jgi:hypothetical protein
MSRIPLMPVFLIWVGLTGLFLLFYALGTTPFNMLQPQDLILYTEEMKLFFIALLMPLLIKSPYQLKEPLTPLSFYMQNLMQMLVFLLLLLPISIFCGEIAGLKHTQLISLHIFYLIIALIVITLKNLETKPETNLIRYYYLIILLATIGIPILYYLKLELSNRAIDGLLYLNPFWLIKHILIVT